MATTPDVHHYVARFHEGSLCGHKHRSESTANHCRRRSCQGREAASYYWELRNCGARKSFALQEYKDQLPEIEEHASPGQTGGTMGSAYGNPEECYC